jgi:hypothetical protein
MTRTSTWHGEVIRCGVDTYCAAWMHSSGRGLNSRNGESVEQGMSVSPQYSSVWPNGALREPAGGQIP